MFTVIMISFLMRSCKTYLHSVFHPSSSLPPPLDLLPHLFLLSLNLISMLWLSHDKTQNKISFCRRGLWQTVRGSSDRTLQQGFIPSLRHQGWEAWSRIRVPPGWLSCRERWHRGLPFPSLLHVPGLGPYWPVYTCAHLLLSVYLRSFSKWTTSFTWITLWVDASWGFLRAP